MTGFVFGTLFVLAVLGLAFLTLYLPSLVITRLLFYWRRRRGPIFQLLARPIGPSIPGRGADRSALRHALRRWAMLGFKTGSSAVAFGVIAPWHALFGGPAEGWLVVAFVIVTCTALFASVVSAVECAFLLVRLLLHRPGNPGESGKVDRQKPADQLRRAANGMRTNYRAARRGRSRDEFKSKLGVVFEEADETADWLRYFRDTGMCHDPKLVKEGEELARIFAASVKTARKTYFSTSSTFPLGKVGFPP